jgi:hypothetical protein
MECRKGGWAVKARSKVREEVKGLVRDRFFKKYDCTTIIENIDFAVKDRASANDRASGYYLWAEAKAGPADVCDMLAQQFGVAAHHIRMGAQQERHTRAEQGNLRDADEEARAGGQPKGRAAQEGREKTGGPICAAVNARGLEREG